MRIAPSEAAGGGRIETAGLAKAEVARRLGVSPQAVTNWTSGQARPSRANLVQLEEVVVVAAHDRAFRALLAQVPPVRRVTIIGGGLFPRTALVLQKVLPDAALTIVDARAEHLELARTFLRCSVRSASSSPPGSTADASPLDT